MPDDSAKPDQPEDTRDTIERLLEAGDSEQALARLAALHPADQAELIGRLDPELCAPLFARIPADALVELLGYLKREPRRRLVAVLEPAALGPLLDRIDFDDAVDILQALLPAQSEATLAAMRTASEVAPLLAHPDTTAGGRMTTDFVALNRDWTVDRTLSHLRQAQPDAEQVFYLYVVDDAGRLEGVVSLRHLVVAAPGESIGELMTRDAVSVQTREDQEEVARRIQRYNFIALPVVDEERRLVGVVSVDDLMDVAEEEATEDMYRMAGLDEEESLLRPIARSIAPRLGWLLVALVSVGGAAAVVAAFAGTIERFVALAVFMPVIAGLGGNAGVQTITLMVRSLALGHVAMRDVRHVLQRELIIGVANGLVIGLLLALAAYAWKQNVGLSVVAGVAMLLSMTTAVTVGVLAPLLLRAARLDPALASGVLVTGVTDVLGFFFFLGLATLMIDRIA